MSKSCNQIDVAIGRRVRLARMQAGISQEKLAERLGLTFQQIQKYEKGVNRIAGSRLVAIARELGRQVGYFVDDPAAVGAGLPQADPIVALAETLALRGPAGRKLLEAAATIPDARLAALADVAAGLALRDGLDRYHAAEPANLQPAE